MAGPTLGRVGLSSRLSRRAYSLPGSEKPQYSLVQKDSTVILKLCDFGTAKKLELQGTASTMVGTFRWMAPETMRNEPYSIACDIYSLAITIYEIFVRKSSKFLSTTHLANSPTPPRRLPRSRLACAPTLPDNLALPQRLVRMIDQCWDNDPELRPTVTELIQRVERYKAEARARAAAKGGPVGSGFTFATVAGGAKPECRLWNSKRHTPQRLLWKCRLQICPQLQRLRQHSSRPSSKICALFQRS
eukprot:TRINITY_DN184_c0_g1_i8.p1 TRINITY_DN184_c0_g1~~TRINITY_DN184_c0_g1_i8.p1  ORF type:complete len:268 (-),score=33.55 TRINITY_DN184_c0_g1_i8:254-991(-)